MNGEWLSFRLKNIVIKIEESINIKNVKRRV